MQKKQTILVVASLLVVVLSVTLAYFTAQIIGKGKTVTINSADLKIIFTDSDGNIEGNDITPGWSNSKTFTVKNESNGNYKYNIVIKDLVNTFVTEGYLQYKITSTDGGYKYGEDTSLDTIRNNTTDSTIKTTIDTWYKNSLKNYTKYLSTSAVYCNDRSLGTGQTYSASSNFDFASYYRMDYDTKGAKANPSYNCTDIRDAFSVDNTSAKLDYPVSLMTADEIAFAGGVAFKTMNNPYAWFINNSAGTQVSSYWWSLSPSYLYESGSRVWLWFSIDVYLYRERVDASIAVRPAISLKSCTLYNTGDGSATNPYTILETESGC